METASANMAVRRRHLYAKRFILKMFAVMTPILFWKLS
jgi:hypothetical protein